MMRWAKRMGKELGEDVGDMDEALEEEMASMPDKTEDEQD